MNLNIMFSDSAFNEIGKIFNLQPRDMVMFRDDLTWGPVHAIHDLEQWMQQRDHFWQCEGDSEPFSFRHYPDDFYTITSIITQADSIVLWLDETLKAQLSACCVLAICRLLNVSYQRISLRCYYLSDEGDGEFGRIPLPATYAPLQQFCIVKVLSELEWEYRLQCWDAYTSKTPEKLLSMMDADNSACFVMQRALNVLKNRFPAYASGLTIWDEQILKAALRCGLESKAAKVMAYTLYPAHNDVDTVLDSYIYHRILTLGASHLSMPLLTLNVENMPVKRCTVSITDAGIAALKGEFNTLKVNGFSDWIGGGALNSAADGIWLRHADGSIQYAKSI